MQKVLFQNIEINVNEKFERNITIGLTLAHESFQITTILL